MKENNAEESKIKQFWNWIWHSDSFFSWIVALIFAFVIVKFLFFPVISVILATKLPLVVVESGSMQHPGTFIGNVIGSQNAFQSWWQEMKGWYEDRGITEEEAETWSLKTGLEKGDIVIVSGWGTPEVGDVIIFNANTAHPIIHRIVSIEEVNGEKVYSTKGDNNSDQLYSEKQISEDAVIGKALVRIPKLGWLKLAFVEVGSLFS